MATLTRLAIGDRQIKRISIGGIIRDLLSSTAYALIYNADSVTWNGGDFDPSNITADGTLIPEGSATAPVSSTETLYGDTALTNFVVDDPDNYNLGVVVRAEVAGQITHVRWFRGPSDSYATRTVYVWATDGTELATGSGDTATTSAWNDVALSAPLDVTAGQTVVVGVFAPNPADYATVTDLGVAGMTSAGGNLVAPTSADAGGQGRFIAPANGMPTQSYNNTGYGVDLVFQPGAV